MSNVLTEINAALHNFRVSLANDIRNPDRWRQAAELITITFEIEKLALKLEEGIKGIDGLKIPAAYSDTLAISDLISLIESLQPGTAIHPATKLPLEQTPSFLIAKKWLSQGVCTNSAGNHIADAQQKLQQAYNLVIQVSEAFGKYHSLAIAGCETLRDLSKFQQLISESQHFISATDLERSSRASSPASETSDHQYSGPLQQKGANCND